MKDFESNESGVSDKLCEVGTGRISRSLSPRYRIDLDRDEDYKGLKQNILLLAQDEIFPFALFV